MLNTANSCHSDSVVGVGIGFGDAGRSAFEELVEGCRRDDNCEDDEDAAAREDKMDGDEDELRMDSKW